ncbi:SSI family serine proteinase inhibitor [Streptomyces apocyni]|uniref:SSI family serine proteinase inhibitor n=1 Tax=Streptomyces apocyni TaxID=2654677 RepID=UPI0012EAE388|nr:SSI family serine proteinase inhibitor [Streptomyces apocyni]
MLRRLVLSATVSLAALAAGSAAYACPLGDVAPVPGQPGVQEPDRLIVTATGAGGEGAAYELECAPVGGTHPSAGEACEVLERAAAEGRDPFAPVPEDAMCMMIYGGPETARVTGTWQGRPVDATYERTDGCEISRWDSLGAVLPPAGA